jgi:hypothetical protein
VPDLELAPELERAELSREEFEQVQADSELELELELELEPGLGSDRGA